MAYLEVKNVRIAGISACVPQEVEENSTLPLFSSSDEYQKFVATTGIERRHISQKHLPSDLCFHAAEKLIKDLGWQRESVDALVFVTQYPDYILPATSCVLQKRLGLSEECYSLDISLGCSGWVYGLSVAANLLSTGSMKRALFLCGDTNHPVSPRDKSTYPLFGAAGTATALEYKENEIGFRFHLATDGSGYETIIIPDGGFRNPFSEKSLEITEIEPGICRNNLHIALNGMNVFTFGISKAPETVKKLSERFTISIDSVDYFVFHQANKFMNEKIRKKLNLPTEKVPYSLRDFGNTSSATIPLTIVTELRQNLLSKKHMVVGCGFGVGLSWGSVAFELERIIIPDLIEI